MNDIEAILKRVSMRSLDTAHRLKSALRGVFNYGIRKWYRTSNPTETMKGVLPTNKHRYTVALRREVCGHPYRTCQHLSFSIVSIPNIWPLSEPVRKHDKEPALKADMSKWVAWVFYAKVRKNLR